MEKEMMEFQKNALLGNVSAEPLCTQYKQAWRACGDNNDLLVRLALSQQSIPFLSHACYKGLGLTKEYVLKRFGDCINGKKTYDDVEGAKGYTYQMYAGFDGDMTVSADVTCMMWTDADVSIPETKCPRLYISNKSHVTLSLDGFNSPMIYLFDESVLEIADADAESTIVVYKYSNDASVVTGKYCLADVRVFEKELKL